MLINFTDICPVNEFSKTTEFSIKSDRVNAIAFSIDKSDLMSKVHIISDNNTSLYFNYKSSNSFYQMIELLKSMLVEFTKIDDLDHNGTFIFLRLDCVVGTEFTYDNLISTNKIYFGNGAFVGCRDKTLFFEFRRRLELSEV